MCVQFLGLHDATCKQDTRLKPPHWCIPKRISCIISTLQLLFPAHLLLIGITLQNIPIVCSMYVWYYLTILKYKFSHTKAPDWINDKDLTAETSDRVKVGGKSFKTSSDPEWVSPSSDVLELIWSFSSRPRAVLGINIWHGLSARQGSLSPTPPHLTAH